MEGLFVGILVGIGVSAAGWMGYRFAGAGKGAPRIESSSSLETLKAVGELVVLKVYTQQIVTRTDHLFGDWGERWLKWLVSSKKTAMIFDFIVDFRYDLKSPLFKPSIESPERLKLMLPPCFYEIQMKDIRIYDERGAALVPILLPEWLGQVFGGKFTEKEKNELIRAARQEAEGLAKELTQKILGEVQHSAESTLRSIARAMGYSSVEFVFNESGPVQGQVDLSRIEQTAREAVSRTGTEG